VHGFLAYWLHAQDQSGWRERTSIVPASSRDFVTDSEVGKTGIYPLQMRQMLSGPHEGEWIDDT